MTINQYIDTPKRLISAGLLPNSPLFQILIRTASLSDVHFKHAAAIIDKKGFLISLGYNHFVSTKHNKNNPTVHAEVAALRSADRRSLKGGLLIVVRKNKQNCFLYSRPCRFCESVIKKYVEAYGLKMIAYS